MIINLEAFDCRMSPFGTSLDEGTLGARSLDESGVVGQLGQLGVFVWVMAWRVTGFAAPTFGNLPFY
jgi:hypothetical protein